MIHQWPWEGGVQTNGIVHLVTKENSNGFFHPSPFSHKTKDSFYWQMVALVPSYQGRVWWYHGHVQSQLLHTSRRVDMLLQISNIKIYVLRIYVSRSKCQIRIQSYLTALEYRPEPWWSRHTVPHRAVTARQKGTKLRLAGRLSSGGREDWPGDGGCVYPTAEML